MTQELTAPGYYGLPILKKPFWKWEIAGYFFFEGISAGTYILCAMAEFAAAGKFTDAITRGRYLSFATLLPCPPLLIGDLGRPERFHHMLRMFKRTSPMNHGAWALTGYGLFCGLGLLQKFIPQRLASMLGMPFALTMLSYPGVLLSTTAIPVWSHTNFLGPLFAASSMSTAVSAMTVFNYHSEDERLHRALARLEDAAAVTEAATVTAYVASAKRAARPLTRGKQSKLFLYGAVLAGIAIPALLRRSKSKPVRSLIAPLLSLAGGLALKWSVTYAGQESVLDTDLAVHNSPAKTGEPFWGPASKALT